MASEECETVGKSQATIVLFSSFLPPTVGGIATVLSTLLPEFHQHGVNIVVVAPTERPPEAGFLDITWLVSQHLVAGRKAWQCYIRGEVDSWGQTLSEMQKAGAGIAQELLPFTPDLINSHSDWFLSTEAACRSGTPHVATLHGYPPNPEDFEAEGLPYNARIDKMREQVGKMYCSRMTAVSHFTRGRWVDVGVPANIISIIPNPIRLDLFRLQPCSVRNQIRRELGIPSDVNILCYPQRPDKLGVSTLVDAFGIIRRIRSDVILLICGSDDLPLPLNQRVVKLGIQPFVIVRAFRLDQMPSVYAASDIVVLPNPVEPFGLPALEALASGVPVIACGSGAYAELLRDEETALFFRPRDAAHLAERICHVMENGTIRARLARAPMEVLQRYSPDVIAAEYLHLFNEVLGLAQTLS